METALPMVLLRKRKGVNVEGRTIEIVYNSSTSTPPPTVDFRVRS